MAELVIARAALRDLRRIRALGIREHGITASDRHLAGFDRLFALLRDQPFAGQERSEFTGGVRSLSHRPHRILYSVHADTVVIERIIHQAQDARRALRKEQ